MVVVSLENSVTSIIVLTLLKLLTAIISVITSIILFKLIPLFVNFGFHSLDLQVTHVQQEQLYRDEKEKNKQLQRKVLELHSYFSFINYYRPLHRNHVVNKLTTTQINSDVPNDDLNECELLHTDSKPGVQPIAPLVIYTSSQTHRSQLSLEELLEHPVTIELLKDSLRRLHCEEMGFFVLDTKRYAEIKDESIRGKFARILFDTYISTTAQYQVNIAYCIRTSIQEQITASEFSNSVNLFAKARFEVLQLILDNLAISFPNSREYALSRVVLRGESEEWNALSSLC
jgi:hypothetical protein